MVRSYNIRSDQEFSRIIKFIQAKYLLEGKKAPSTTSITRVIARTINREDLLKNVFIRF